MKSLDLSFISKNRSAFMGIAILWIFFYHTGVDIPGLRALFSVGWIGVDIFFLVSGFGLCASLSKNTSVQQFYKRRFIRIIPTWWTVLLIASLAGIAFSLKGFPHTIADFAYWFTSMGYWTAHCNYEWYIPTLILFYLFAPLIAKMSQKAYIYIMIVASVVAICMAWFGIMKYASMSYSRVSVYILGFYVYKLYSQKITIPYRNIVVLAIFGVLLFGIGYILKSRSLSLGLTIARQGIPCFMLPVLALIAWGVQRFTTINSAFKWLGAISLEVYLLHINHEISAPISGFIATYVPIVSKIIWFAVVVIAGWILHELMARLTNKIFTK